MIVSHNYKFIFIKTAKTAGTSMTIYLSHFCGEGDLITRLKKEEIEYGNSLGYRFPHGFKTQVKSLKLAVWKMIKNFQSDQQLMKTSGYKIRKNLSAYSAQMYLGQQVWNNYFKFCFERDPFDKAVSLYYWHTRDMEKGPEINEYIQKADRSKLSNWRLYTIDDQVAVDFVGRYENLDEDVRFVAEKLGLPNHSLPNAKGDSRSNHQHYSQILNQDSRRHIEIVCAKEIEMFKYSWVTE